MENLQYLATWNITAEKLVVVDLLHLREKNNALEFFNQLKRVKNELNETIAFEKKLANVSYFGNNKSLGYLAVDTRQFKL